MAKRPRTFVDVLDESGSENESDDEVFVVKSKKSCVSTNVTVRLESDDDDVVVIDEPVPQENTGTRLCSSCGHQVPVSNLPLHMGRCKSASSAPKSDPPIHWSQNRPNERDLLAELLPSGQWRGVALGATRRFSEQLVRSVNDRERLSTKLAERWDFAAKEVPVNHHVEHDRPLQAPVVGNKLAQLHAICVPIFVHTIRSKQPERVAFKLRPNR